MKILNAEGVVLKIQDYSLDNIPNILEPIFNTSSFSEYSIKDLLEKMEEATNEKSSKKGGNYLLWLENENIIGYAFLEHLKDSEAFTCFKTFKDKSIPQEFLQAYLEASTCYWFKEYNLNKLLFDANKNSPEGLGKLFLKIFHPYPIGWIHLGDSKYVLTKDQLNHIEENLYKL